MALEEFQSYYRKSPHPNSANLDNITDRFQDDQYRFCVSFLEGERSAIRDEGDAFRKKVMNHMQEKLLNAELFCHDLWKLDRIREVVFNILKFVRSSLRKYDIPTSRMKPPPFRREDLTVFPDDADVLNVIVKSIHPKIPRKKFYLQPDPLHGGMRLATDEC